MNDHRQGECRCGWPVPVTCLAVPIAKLYEMQTTRLCDVGPEHAIAEPHAIFLRCPLCNAPHGISFDHGDVQALNDIRTKGAPHA